MLVSTFKFALLSKILGQIILFAFLFFFLFLVCQVVERAEKIRHICWATCASWTINRIILLQFCTNLERWWAVKFLYIDSIYSKYCFFHLFFHVLIKLLFGLDVINSGILVSFFILSCTWDLNASHNVVLIIAMVVHISWYCIPTLRVLEWVCVLHLFVLFFSSWAYIIKASAWGAVLEYNMLSLF